MRKFLTVCAITLMLAFSVKAGGDEPTLTETINKLSTAAAKGYVSPVISAFGSNLNTGWVTSVPENKLFGVDFEIRFVGQGSFFADDAKEFSTSGKFRFTEAQANVLLDNSGITNPVEREQLRNLILQDEFTLNIAGPTIVGDDSKEVEIFFPGKTYGGSTIDPATIKTGAKGFLGVLPLLPMAAIQLNVGTVYGTQLAVRLLPSVELGDMGKFSFFGVGVIHNPAPYVPVELPLDLGVGVFYQSMKVGDVFETSAMQFGFYASKHFGMSFLGVTPYAGVTIESSTTTLKYDFEYSIPVAGVIQTAKEKVSIDLDANNSAAFTVGAKFNIGFFNLFADYKAAKTSTVNGGISFAF